MPEDDPFSHLVVVGSSAGGVEALSELVTTLPVIVIRQIPEG